MKYIEFGIGNDSFVNTEIEEDERESRVKGISRIRKVKDVYLRVWVKKNVWILSARDGLKKTRKNRTAFKFLLGVAGE
jgi:hypothetical protein